MTCAGSGHQTYDPPLTVTPRPTHITATLTCTSCVDAETDPRTTR
ncbi:hypothetical protein ACFC6L_11535 [Kitasatospora phosalacinea]